MCRVHLVRTEYASWRNHSDGELPFLHLVNLYPRSLCPEQDITVNVKCILLILRGMVSRNVQRLKVIIVLFYLRSLYNLIPHAGKNSLDLFKCNGVRVTVSHLVSLSRKCHVNHFRFHLCLAKLSFHICPRLVQNPFDFLPRLVDKLPYLRSVLRCHILHAL